MSFIQTLSSSRVTSAFIFGAIASVTSCASQQSPLPASENAIPVAAKEVSPPCGVFYAKDSQLFSPRHEPVVLRGVNKMAVWNDTDGAKSFANIRAAGANTVRIAWLTPGNSDNHQHTTIADLAAVIDRAIAEGLLPVVELHDSSGIWDLDPLIAYWTHPEVVAILKAREGQMMLNVANEAGRVKDVTREQFITDYGKAIRQIRAAGLSLPIMIDALEYGSDLETIEATGPTLLEIDPLRNLVFSTHAYWAERPRAFVDEAMARIAKSPLTIIIGEYGPGNGKCEPDDRYLTVLERAHANQTGWFAWSWGPGNVPCGNFDITRDDTVETLTPFGKVVVEGEFGLKTATPISVAPPPVCADATSGG